MTPRATQVRRIAGKERSQRILILQAVVDHFISGPSELLPPKSQSRSDQWLESSLGMVKYRPYRGPVEARQIYHVPNVVKGVEGYLPKEALYPVVRQVLWDRARDRDRASIAAVKRPSVSANLFSVTKRRFGELKRLSMELDRSMSTFPFQVEGISLALPESSQPDEEDVNELCEDHTPPVHYWLSVHRSLSQTGVMLSCSLGNEEFSGAFIRLWDFLGSICGPQNRIRGRWKEDWLIPPRRYTQALNSTLGQETST